MAKYVLMGKYSNEFSSAMVHTPQDRMDVVEPMLNNFGVKLIEFLYIPNNEAKYNYKAATKHLIPVDLEKKNLNKVMNIALKAHNLIVVTP